MHPVNMSATIFFYNTLLQIYIQKKKGIKVSKIVITEKNNEKLNKQSKRLNRKVGPGGTVFVVRRRER